MASFKICLSLAVVAIVGGSPAAKSSFWKGTSFDTTVQEMRSMCNNDDAIACLKFKAMSFLDNIFQKDSYKLSDSVEINRNSYRSNEISGRSESTIESNIEEYVKSHDVAINLPIFGTKITLGAKNLEQDELDVKVNFDASTEGQARKSKLKKIFVPILVFVLLKAMTLIPLALGILGLKAWNALQLSFFSFIVSVSLAVFQLCKKLASDNHPQLAAHGAWDPGFSSHYASRSMDISDDAQHLAYSGYRQ